MDKWEQFAHTGEIRDYLAYKAEETKVRGIGERHEQSGLHIDRYRFICSAGRRL